MRTSTSEEESLRTHPEEFVKLALDTCDRQVLVYFLLTNFKTIISLDHLQLQDSSCQIVRNSLRLY